MLCLKTISVLFVLLFLLKNNNVENMAPPMMTEMKFIDVSDKKAGSSISESNSKKDISVDEKSSTNNVQESESSDDSDSKITKSGGGLDDNLLFLILAGIIVYFLSGKDFLR